MALRWEQPVRKVSGWVTLLRWLTWLTIAAPAALWILYRFVPLGLLTTYYIATGNTGGNYWGYGHDLARTLIAAHPPLFNIQADPSSGTVENLLRLTSDRTRENLEAGRREAKSDASAIDRVNYADLAFLQDTPWLNTQAAAAHLAQVKFQQREEGIVSPDQWKAYADLLKDAPAPPKNGAPPHPVAMPMEQIRVLALIDLTYLHVVVRLGSPGPLRTTT